MSLSRFIFKNEVEISIAPFLRKAVESNMIKCEVKESEEGKRLDHYAFEAYGDGSLWWVIAAASGIGWWMQMPAGVKLLIPIDIGQVEKLKERI